MSHYYPSKKRSIPSPIKAHTYGPRGDRGSEPRKILGMVSRADWKPEMQEVGKELRMVLPSFGAKER